MKASPSWSAWMVGGGSESIADKCNGRNYSNDGYDYANLRSMKHSPRPSRRLDGSATGAAAPAAVGEKRWALLAVCHLFYLTNNNAKWKWKWRRGLTDGTFNFYNRFPCRRQSVSQQQLGSHHPHPRSLQSPGSWWAWEARLDLFHIVIRICFLVFRSAFESSV